MESNNGDGQIFLTKDGRVQITVSGSNNVLSKKLGDEFDNAIMALKQEMPSAVIGYTRLKDYWYVISGFRGENIFYTKKFLANDEFITIEITYPEAERAKWDKLVAKLASDFQIKTIPDSKVSASETAKVEVTPPPAVKPKRNVWFTPESGFTECIEARSGPAGRIEDSKGMNPSVVEKDGGRVVQVKAYRDQGDTIVTWMFYRDKAECERVETNVEKKLADKYR